MTNALTAYRAELAWRIRNRRFKRLVESGREQTLLLMVQVKAELKELDERYRQRMKAALNP